MTPAEEMGELLSEVNAEYTEELNMVLEEGREDLVADISDRYLREVARLLRQA